MHEKTTDIIYPVILKVPDDKQALFGRESAVFLRQYARQAVILSAQKIGMDLPVMENDTNGAPIPLNGVFWSLSHKPKYVAGVTSTVRVGIDIEPVKPVQPSLFNRVIDDKERRLTDLISDKLFYRYWTAKEAVLKVTGAGLAGLSQCKINHVIDRTSLAVSYCQKLWMIQQAYHDNHVISVVSHDKNIQWVMPVPGN